MPGVSPSISPLFCVFGNIDQFSKRFLVCHGQFRKNFSVDVHACHFQAMDKFVIRNAVHACGRINACNPQFTEVTLTLTAVTVCIHQRFHDLLFCRTEQRMFGTKITSSQFQYLFATCTRHGTTFHSCHNKSLLKSLSLGVSYR